LDETYADILDDRGQIRDSALDDLLIEIISGKSIFESGDELYASRPPLMAELDAARLVFRRKVHEASKAGLPSRQEMEKLAIARGVVDAHERAEIASLEAFMQRLHSSREGSTDEKYRIELAAQLEDTYQRLAQLKAADESLFAHTAEAKAEFWRMNFLTSRCTLSGELLDIPLWETWEEFRACENLPLVRDARRAFVRVFNGLPITIIRAVARTSEWRTRWKASRESGTQLFDGSSADWDANKRNLVWWSDFYDAIYRHPECPPDETIRDDKSLQDWVNKQIAKSKKSSRDSKRPEATQNPTKSFRLGDGRRVPAVKVGEESIKVNTPIRIRASR
jgi:hypothetical protein